MGFTGLQCISAECISGLTKGHSMLHGLHGLIVHQRAYQLAFKQMHSHMGLMGYTGLPKSCMLHGLHGLHGLIAMGLQFSLIKERDKLNIDELMQCNVTRA